MSKKDTIIRAEELAKVYRVPRNGHMNVSSAFALFFKVLRGDFESIPHGFEAFHALKPINFEIRKGEALGIIGRNGSGKSTLLQLLAGTLKPSSGTVEIKGQVSALLELGSGISKDYTGLENIYLNGAILGLKDDYIKEKEEEIIAFADIGEFIYQPVKTYSSGMRVRLAFAVLATVRPEILIIDEALSVGDAFFQSKCARWLESYIQSGGSLLCVSHDMFMLQRLCDRGILLEKGECLLDDSISKAATLYYKIQQNERAGPKVPSPEPDIDEEAEAENALEEAKEERNREGLIKVDFSKSERTGAREAEIVSIETNTDLLRECRVGTWVRFRVGIRVNEDMEHVDLGIGLRDRSGQLIGGFHTGFTPIELKDLKAGEQYSAEVEIKLDFKPRPYLLLVGLGLIEHDEHWVDIDTLWECSQVIIQGSRQFWALAPIPYKDFKLERESVGK